jgi:hypothetical protein
MPGPAPKRSEERTRRPEPAGGPARQGELRPVSIPRADPKWHPRAKAWYGALRSSGMSDYYQNSDWSMALFACDLMTHIYEQRFYRCAQMIAELNAIMGRLGTTEGDRRAVLRLELSEPDADAQDATVVAIAAYKDILSGKQAQ